MSLEVEIDRGARPRPDRHSRYSTLPMQLSRGAGRVHERHAPLLGEHNEEILGELGLTWSEVDVLEADGIIGGSLLHDT